MFHYYCLPDFKYACNIKCIQITTFFSTYLPILYIPNLVYQIDRDNSKHDSTKPIL